MVEGQTDGGEDGRMDGRMDGWTLFHRTLPAEARGPKTFLNCNNTNDLMLVIVKTIGRI